jgi:hypothetical protein
VALLHGYSGNEFDFYDLVGAGHVQCVSKQVTAFRIGYSPSFPTFHVLQCHGILLAITSMEWFISKLYWQLGSLAPSRDVYLSIKVPDRNQQATSRQVVFAETNLLPYLPVLSSETIINWNTFNLDVALLYWYFGHEFDFHDLVGAGHAQCVSIQVTAFRYGFSPSFASFHVLQRVILAIPSME